MKKRKPLPPRVKRMSRQGRLASVRIWLPKFNGKNLLRSYCKHFAVDWRCAAIELQMLGVKLEPAYLAQRDKTEAEAIKQRLEKKRQEEAAENEHWHPYAAPVDAYLAGDYAALYDVELRQMADEDELRVQIRRIGSRPVQVVGETSAEGTATKPYLPRR